MNSQNRQWIYTVIAEKIVNSLHFRVFRFVFGFFKFLFFPFISNFRFYRFFERKNCKNIKNQQYQRVQKIRLTYNRLFDPKKHQKWTFLKLTNQNVVLGNRFLYFFLKWDPRPFERFLFSWFPIFSLFYLWVLWKLKVKVIWQIFAVTWLENKKKRRNMRIDKLMSNR